MAILLRTNTDANNFLDAAGIARTEANGSIVIGICQLTTDLKNYGLWDKMKAIYPFVGQAGVSSSFEVNLKDPNRFRGTFSGGWTFSSTGVQGNGSNNYINVNFKNSDFNSYDSTSVFYYGNAGVNANSWDIGNIFGTPNARITAPPGGTILYYQFNSTNISNITVDSIDGFLGMNRISNTQVNVFKNNTKLATVNETSIANTNTNTFAIGSQASNGSINNSDRLFKFTSFGAGLTDTEAANLYTAVQRFQTTLGRQV